MIRKLSKSGAFFVVNIYEVSNQNLVIFSTDFGKVQRYNYSIKETIG